MQTPLYFYDEFYDKWDKVMSYYDRLFFAFKYLEKNFAVLVVKTKDRRGGYTTGNNKNLDQRNYDARTFKNESACVCSLCEYFEKNSNF